MKPKQTKTAPKCKFFFLRPAIITALSFLPCSGHFLHYVECQATLLYMAVPAEVWFKEGRIELRSTWGSLGL